MNLKQLWKQFDKDAEACYSKWNGEIRMDWSDDEIRTWQKAYETVKAILAAGREKDPAFCREMKDLDEGTAYAHDLGTWMEDYLDVLDMAEAYPELLGPRGERPLVELSLEPGVFFRTMHGKTAPWC